MNSLHFPFSHDFICLSMKRFIRMCNILVSLPPTQTFHGEKIPKFFTRLGLPTWTMKKNWENHIIFTGTKYSSDVSPLHQWDWSAGEQGSDEHDPSGVCTDQRRLACLQSHRCQQGLCLRTVTQDCHQTGLNFPLLCVTEIRLSLVECLLGSGTFINFCIYASIFSKFDDQFLNLKVIYHTFKIKTNL